MRGACASSGSTDLVDGGRVAALYLQGQPGAPPAASRTALHDLTTKDIVANANSANDHLLFTNL